MLPFTASWRIWFGVCGKISGALGIYFKVQMGDDDLCWTLGSARPSQKGRVCGKKGLKKVAQTVAREGWKLGSEEGTCGL